MNNEALARLKKNVIDEHDWSYVECSTDPGEPNLCDDVKTVLGDAERIQAGLAKHAEALRQQAEAVDSFSTPTPPPWCNICQGRAPDGVGHDGWQLPTVNDIQHTDDCPVTLARQALKR